MRCTGGEARGQKVFWEWKGPYYLLAILATALLSSESGSQHGVHVGGGTVRSENQPLLPLFLSPQQTDLGRDGRTEGVLDGVRATTWKS